MSASKLISEGKGQRKHTIRTRRSLKQQSDNPQFRKSTNTETRKPGKSHISDESKKASGKYGNFDVQSVDKTVFHKNVRKSLVAPNSRKAMKSEETSELRKATERSVDSSKARKSEDLTECKQSGKVNNTPSKMARNYSDEPQLSNVKGKREIEIIFGITDQRGVLEFIIKFKKENTAELIPCKFANIDYPQEVIKFYQERLRWKSQ